jgi:hypothetical protein
MDYDDVVDMMICYLIIYVSTGAIDWFLPSVQDACQVGGCRWHRWTSLDSRSSQGVDCLWFAYLCYCICDIRLVYYDVVCGSMTCWLMDAG